MDCVLASYIKNKGIGKTKTQKLLYYSCVLSLKKGWDFPHVDFEKWDYGPVCKEVFTKWDNLGSLPTENIPISHICIMNAMIEILSNYGANTLSEYSHNSEPYKNAKSNEILDLSKFGTTDFEEHLEGKMLNQYDGIPRLNSELFISSGVISSEDYQKAQNCELEVFEGDYE